MKPENIRFFDSAADFRAWLQASHDAAQAQWVGFYKKAAGPRGMTYDEAVGEALCFGWIDGQTNRVDDLSVTTRFSPRRPTSNWSEANIARVKELTGAGRMHPAGLRAFEARRPPAGGAYTYETRPADLPAELAAIFSAQPAAWEFWRAQTPSYRKSMIWWVVSAKQESTRLRRLEALIAESVAQRRIDELHLPRLRDRS